MPGEGGWTYEYHTGVEVGTEYYFFKTFKEHSGCNIERNLEGTRYLLESNLLQ